MNEPNVQIPIGLPPVEQELMKRSDELYQWCKSQGCQLIIVATHDANLITTLNLHSEMHTVNMLDQLMQVRPDMRLALLKVLDAQFRREYFNK